MTTQRITKAMVETRCVYITRQMRKAGLIPYHFSVATVDTGGVKWWARIAIVHNDRPTIAIHTLGTETHTTRSAFDALNTMRDTLHMIDALQTEGN